MKLSQLEVFEVYAHAFRTMTGMMAPGKSEAPMANHPHTHEERHAAYNQWWKDNGRACSAMVRAVEAIIPGDEE